MPVVIEVIEGPGLGRSFRFDAHDVVLIGRSSRCHFSVGLDGRCSRVHLVMEANPPQCRLRDVGSRNGTFVNGQRVREAELSDGDTVLVGQTVLRIRVEEPQPEVQAEQAGLAPVRVEGEPDVPVAEAGGDGEGLRFQDSEGAAAGDQIVFGEPEPDHGGDRVSPPRCGRCGRPATEGEVQAWMSSPDGRFVCGTCRDAPQAGSEIIPGYRLVQQIGEGGMGIVWLAQQARTGRQVAVKMLRPELATSRNAIRMFDRETRISRSLQHPRIVEVLDAGRHHGLMYVVMEYIEGTDAERLRQARGGTLPAAEAVSIALQALEALEYAHERRVVHRDIKPPNLLVSGELPNRQVKVTDFGLARIYGAAGRSGITHEGDVRGSVPYMPPEQVLNCRGVDHRADLFGLGATLYHLLTGQFVFDFRPAEKDPLLTVIEDEVVPIERRGVRIEAALAQAIDRAVRKNSAERYRSAREMNQALRNVRV